MISDDEVWDALTAYEHEIREWRIFKRHDGCSVAVRDAAGPMYEAAGMTACNASLEYQVVRDRETAEKYVRWQAMKIALEHKTERSDK